MSAPIKLTLDQLVGVERRGRRVVLTFRASELIEIDLGAACAQTLAYLLADTVLPLVC